MHAKILLFLTLLSLMLAPFASADMGAATQTLATTPPAFAADVTIPATMAARHVFGSVQVTASAITGGQIIMRTCAGAAFQSVVVPAGGGGNTIPYSFTLTGGTCYEFANIADPATANAISLYSFVDVALESFEGRPHANTTRTEMNATRTSQNDIQNSTRTSQNDIQNSTRTTENHAQNATRTSQNDIQNSTRTTENHEQNATRTSQNDIQNSTRTSQNDIQNATNAATYCPLTGAGCYVPLADMNGNFTGGNFTGNFSGDFNNTNATGNFSGNFTDVNATGNFTGNLSGTFNGSFIGNFTTGTLGGNVTILTTYDSWFPVLLWGVIAMILLWVEAFFPAIIAFMNVAAVLPTLATPAGDVIWGMAASVMFFIIAVFLHVLYQIGRRNGWFGKGKQES